MNLELSEEQRLLQETVARLFKEQSTPARIRACEPLGFDADLWAALWAMEIQRMRVPGDGQTSLMHAIVVAEQAGRHLASVPLVEAIAAQRLVAQLEVPAGSWLAQARSQELIIGLALGDLATDVDQLLASGAVADAVLGLEGDTLWLLRDLARVQNQVHGAIPACPLASVHAAVRERIDDPRAAALFRAAREELRLLNAAQVAAAGLRALEIAGEYAGERHAFGRRIGEFQGVSHPLADAYTDVEGARLLCWRVADAIAHGESQAGALVAMASWWAGAGARPAGLKAMRTLGGYGMALEYDPQLYFRRINAWSLVGGVPDHELDLVAARLWSGAATDLPEAGDIGIDFSWGAEGEAAAARMRAFCERRHNDRIARFMRDSLDGFDLELHRELAAEGLLYPDAPKEFGGPGLSGTAAAAVRDVAGDYYWNLLAPSVTDMIAKTIQHFGSDTARRELLPRMFAGETYCTLGYSEPSGGSDIFAAKTTATPANDGTGDWLINGQKMFTSTAHLADYALMITRTGPDKHRGITMFVVPLKQPGFELSEIKTIGDERTNVTYYSDVRVPDAYRIGEVNGGLKILAAALIIEQASGDLHVMSLKSLLRNALEWAQDKRSANAPIERTEVRRALAETATRLAVQEALNRRGVWGQEVKQLQKHHGPMAKLFGSESWLACGRRLMEVAAPVSLNIRHGAEGAIEFLMRRAIPSTIYAGSSEIQRSMIAEAGLGMPRSR